MTQRNLKVYGAAEHNLKNVDVEIPRHSLTVVTGLSGSGKSSLAFDTIYAEGQRRYVESLSAYARQFLDQMQKPKVDHIEGLSPAISIEQKSVSRNPRSTVGTVTEIYDYLRVLYANVGRPHCPECGIALERQTVQDIVDRVLAYPADARVLIMAPIVRGRKGTYEKLFAQALKEGFVRARVNGVIYNLDEPIKLKKTHKHTIEIVVDRLVIKGDVAGRLTDSVEIALKKAEGLVTVVVLPSSKSAGEQPAHEETFSESMACPDHGPQLLEQTPRIFSFNSPYGACPACNGLGTHQEVDLDLLVPDPSLSIREGAVRPWGGFFDKDTSESNETPKKEKPKRRSKKNEEGSKAWNTQLIESVARHFKIDLDRPWKKLSPKHRNLLLHGAGDEKVPIVYRTATGGEYRNQHKWEGVVSRIHRMLKETASEMMRDHYMQYFSDNPCPACGGSRLRPEALAVTIGGQNIAQFSSLSVTKARKFIDGLKLKGREAMIAKQPVKEISERLSFLENVGLDYLTLDRKSGTLAGGEGQRIRLATQIGSRLVGVLYILDEPSIGLHQRDNHRLIETLESLRDLGNTVIVVEHDEDTIRRADYVIDLGPGAGRLGGEVVCAGTPEEIMRSPESITGRYLSGVEKIAVPKKRRPINPERTLIVRGATEHNLKDMDVSFPLGVFTCVTGVSGSGKSTLVNDIFYRRLAQVLYKASDKPGAHKGLDGLELIDKVINVDQSPIGRTPRSNPATYIGLFTLIRDLFSQLPEARARGYQPGRFSFNVKGGRCETCKGDGVMKIEMHFLPDVYVTCDVCKGRRFNRETLEVMYRGRNIAEVLDMTVEEATDFFSAIPLVRSKLQTLCDVGLGYIHLGQQATTLSGGEAQRVKLAKELSKRNTGNTVYVLDEPTTGLHFEDIKHLLAVLNRLVDEGSTVIVIEHNLDVIKTADHLIDLGPEGGEGGGRILGVGTPEKMAQHPHSHTGRFLKTILKR